MTNFECIYFCSKEYAPYIFANADKLENLNFYLKLRNFHGKKCFCASSNKDIKTFKKLLQYIDKKAGRVNVIIDTMSSLPEEVRVILKKLAIGGEVLLVNEWVSIDKRE